MFISMFTHEAKDPGTQLDPKVIPKSSKEVLLLFKGHL